MELYIMQKTQCLIRFSSYAFNQLQLISQIHHKFGNVIFNPQYGTCSDDFV